jgi:hypothetical protein
MRAPTTPLFTRKPCISTNARRIINAAPRHTSPAINRRRRINSGIAARLFKVRLIPITAIRNAVGELVILRSAHSIDRDVEVPRLAHVVELAYFTLLAELAAAGRLGRETLVDDHEFEGVGGEGRAGGGDEGYPVADAACGEGLAPKASWLIAA